MFALLFVVFCGITALVIDAGSVYLEKSNLQNAIDAAVLAGVQDLPDTTKSAATAHQYIQLNGYEPSDISITFSESNRKIDIAGVKEVSYTFARVLGFTSTTVYADAAAVINSQWAGEALPFINLDDDYSTDPEIVAWEKTSPGDFESISGYEIVNPDDPDRIYFKLDYMNGIELKKGTVATIKQEVGYIYDQH